VHMCGLGLSPFSGLVCDLLLRVCQCQCDLLLRDARGVSPECTLPQEYLRHNLDEHCL